MYFSVLFVLLLLSFRFYCMHFLCTASSLSGLLRFVPLVKMLWMCICMDFSEFIFPGFLNIVLSCFICWYLSVWCKRVMYCDLSIWFRGMCSILYDVLRFLYDCERCFVFRMVYSFPYDVLYSLWLREMYCELSVWLQEIFCEMYCGPSICCTRVGLCLPPYGIQSYGFELMYFSFFPVPLSIIASFMFFVFLCVRYSGVPYVWTS